MTKTWTSRQDLELVRVRARQRLHWRGKRLRPGTWSSIARELGVSPEAARCRYRSLLQGGAVERLLQRERAVDQLTARARGGAVGRPELAP